MIIFTITIFPLRQQLLSEKNLTAPMKLEFKFKNFLKMIFYLLSRCRQTARNKAYSPRKVWTLGTLGVFWYEHLSRLFQRFGQISYGHCGVP